MPRHKRKRSSQPKPPEPIVTHSQLLSLVGLAFVLLLTLLAYLPALKGSQLWDDDAHITVPELQSFAGLSHIWFRMGATQQYYPLLHSAFWLAHRLWGDS